MIKITIDPLKLRTKQKNLMYIVLPGYVSVVREVVFRHLLSPFDVPGRHRHNGGAEVVLGHVLVAGVVQQGKKGEDGGANVQSRGATGGNMI